MRKVSILLFISLTFFRVSFAQHTLPKDKEFYTAVIGFYNVENLYDTINDPNKNDEEFLPTGSNEWTGKRYLEKLDHMAKVVSEIGTEANPDGLAILGLCEVENKLVVEDLIKQEKLKGRNYGIVHYDSPDLRGIDVALIYQKKYFKVTNSKSYRLYVPGKTNFFTRDQLVVSGLLDGEMIHVIVGHWPSRRGGEKRSEANRIEAAKLSRHIVDSIYTLDENAKVIVMGDLNDDPTNKSIQKHLNATGDKTLATGNKLYNPMYDLHMKGIGTLAHRDVWGIFDQTILTPEWIKTDYSSFRFYSAKVYNKPYLTQKDGNFKGYPFRTYSGGVYTAGYSDHFAVYSIFVKEKK